MDEKTPRSKTAKKRLVCLLPKYRNVGCNINKVDTSLLYVKKRVRHAAVEEETESHHMLSICTHVKEIIFLLFPIQYDVCV